jgi:hypothetical protein
VNATLDAIIRRLIVFAAASFGTFMLYLMLGELLGASDGQPFEYATGVVVAQITVKAVAALTAGHLIALRLLAFVMRGFATPSLRRCAGSALASATALEVMYLSRTWLSDISVRGLVRVGLATVVSILICAIRARRHDNATEFVQAAGLRGLPDGAEPG